VASKKIFGSVDYAIFKTLWQWAKRRHPRKGKRWIKDKYFKVYDHRNWIFTGTVLSKDGTSKAIHLFSASATPIQRHIKVKGLANPYDPQWTAYFTSRQRKLPVTNFSV
jgi:RNA-directed DNA polymerase